MSNKKIRSSDVTGLEAKTMFDKGIDLSDGDERIVRIGNDTAILKIDDGTQRSADLTPIMKFDNVHAEHGFDVNEDVLLTNPIDKSILENAILLNSTHSACLKITSTMLSGFGYFFKKEPTGVLKDLIEQPNNEIQETFSYILNNLSKDYKKWNEMAIAIKKLSTGKIIIKYCDVSALYVVPYKRVLNTSRKVKTYVEIQENDWLHSGGSSVTYRKYKPLRWDTEIREGVWYLARYSSPSSNNLFFAEPDYLSALYPVAENKKIYDYNSVFFDNNARPDFVFVIKGVDNISDKKKANIENFLKNNYKGSSNAHRVLYLQFEDSEVEVEVIPISGKLKDDAEFRLLKMDNRDDIARAWNVPPKVIGISSSGSLGSGSEALGALKLLKEYIKSDQKVVENFINPVMKKVTDIDCSLRFKKIELTNEKDKAVIFNLLANLRDNNDNPILPYDNVIDDLDLEINDKTDRFIIAKDKAVTANQNGNPRADEGTTDEGDKRHAGETDTDYM